MNEKYPLALPVGTVLAGQYIVEKVLGQGGFGITYEARDHKTNERVAVKEFFPDAMATRTDHTTVSPFSGEKGESFVYGKTCFLQEAETLAKFIGNENIVRIHSYFEENETAYFVMDFIEGTSFDEYLKQRGGKIPYEEAAKILIPVMDALSAVHSKGIVHRDVTPDNIYITEEGVVKLLDFGAARYSLGDQSRSLDIILKHGFAPKEQYTRRGKQGPYTDVYALGATFYFALTGKRPPDSVERLDEDDLVPPSSLGVQISGPAEDAILRALSVQPADRFQDMGSFKSALLDPQRASDVQRPLAAVGSRPAVSQTYFNAPDQASIPPSGPAASPAPGPEQATELQDLAATMKTAGKLAGKLAGRMAGKMAEKTAETAGIMAGTAGKMSEIMAAKKAETAEKLAAKMAELEAARAAEKAAKQAAEQAAAEQAAAEQAAAEAARQAAAGMEADQQAAAGPVEDTTGNAAGGAPERTVGNTAGDTGEIPAKSAPARPAMNKKLLLVLIGAVVVILVVLFAFLGHGAEGNGDGRMADDPGIASQAVKDTPAPTPSTSTAPNAATTPELLETPEPTAPPAPTPTGDLMLVGNYTGNIMNDGLITYDLDGYAYWITDNNGSIYSEAEGRYLTYYDGLRHYDLSMDGGTLFYRRGHTVYAYDPETQETEDVPYLTDDHFNDVTRLFLTKDYYVIARQDTDKTVTVCLISRSDGQTFECCTVQDENMFTISSDGWLYYIDSDMVIYRMDMAALKQEGVLVYATDPDVKFKFPVVAGDYLYFFVYDGSDKTDYAICRIDRTTGDDLLGWDISSELELDLVSPDAIGINVNYKNQDIYFYLAETESSNSSLFQIKGYDDGSFDVEQLPGNSYAPNLVYYTDGSYEVDFLSWDYDRTGYKLYYLEYDANGDQIDND